MSDRRSSLFRSCLSLRWLALTAMLLVGASTSAAADTTAGKLLTANGSVMIREKLGDPWRPLLKNEAIPAKQLLVGLAGAKIDSKNGAVRLAMMSDLDQNSPYPVIESAVILNPNPDVDLDFTLDRGRVDVINQKKEGKARVRVRFLDQVYDLDMNEPGTRVTLVLYGRWKPGAHFTPKPGPEDTPIINFDMIVTKGSVDRKCPVCQFLMTAPPGPAEFRWDNRTGADPRPTKLEKIPAWVADDPATTPRGKAILERLSKFSEEVTQSSVPATIKKYINSDKPEMRRMAVFAAGALDQLAELGDALMQGKDEETWNNAVIALRHWLGRAPGQELVLYKGIQERRKIKPNEAAIVVQLLLGLTEEQEARPETYEVLIELLKNPVMAIRGLSQWHLRRLTPTSKIYFNPAGSKEEIEKGYQAWKQLIPSGKLPPKPMLDDKK